MFSKELAIVTCHFNWCGFTNPKRNLHRFIRSMNGFPVYGIELSLTDKFETTGIEGWKQIRVGWQNVCFQKEALINKLVNEIVPEHFTKIAWIDADVEFSNKNWYNEACIALDYVTVIQLYENAKWTDRFGRIIDTQKAMVIPGPKHGSWSGHPGFALAADRGLWSHGGLYPKAPIGNGDTVFIYSIFGVELQNLSKEGIGITSKDDEEFLNKWREPVSNFVNKKIGYISGDCIHEWHGDRKDRKYTERKEFLKGFKQDWIFINEKGLLEFTSDAKIETIHGMLKFFNERKEDG